MSEQYDAYIKEHCANVRKGFYWIRKSLPELLIDIPGVDYELMILLHDDTKFNNDEYYAYDEYFYGPEHADEYLSRIYGDNYMQLPPVEKRTKPNENFIKI